MKYTYIFLIAFLFSSCLRKDNQILFNKIDYTFYDGWTEYHSIKIDNLGKALILSEHCKKGKLFIEKEISKEELDSLFKLINKINFFNIDTAYYQNCMDCGYYNLIIENDKIYRILVENISNDNPDLIQINKFSSYLRDIITSSINKADSIVFNSKIEDFSNYSPPPLP